MFLLNHCNFFLSVKEKIKSLRKFPSLQERRKLRITYYFLLVQEICIVKQAAAVSSLKDSADRKLPPP